MDNEISKRDKLFEQTVNPNLTLKPKSTSLIVKSSIVNNFKRQLKEYKAQIEQQKKVIDKYQKDIKVMNLTFILPFRSPQKMKVKQW